jgi:Superfamily I DNA and RNA helicases
LVALNDSGEQAQFVAQRILELRDENVDLNDIAVLYRAHYHAVELQLELSRRGIPYQITSGIRFFEQAHIKDVTAFVRVVANPRDEVAFKRMVKLLPGIGNRTAENLWRSWENWLVEGAKFRRGVSACRRCLLQRNQRRRGNNSRIPWTK